MRTAVIAAICVKACVSFSVQTPAVALPLLSSDRVEVSNEFGNRTLEIRHRRHVFVSRCNRYGYVSKQRRNWTCYPYWRPFQYHYWQHYYPYGGPLF